MGGLGSGSWYRWDKQTTCNEVNRVDIRYMKKRGLLNPGTSGSLSWTRGEAEAGSIRYRVEEYRLILNYRHRPHGGDWENVEEVVWFECTPCNYGGKRMWLQCPCCHRRVAILYGPGKRFLCRQCHKLSYSSQMSGELDRLIDQKHKLGKRIYGYYDGEGGGKKKGMHWKTFERLEQKYRTLEMMIDRGISQRFGGIGIVF